MKPLYATTIFLAVKFLLLKRTTQDCSAKYATEPQGTPREVNGLSSIPPCAYDDDEMYIERNLTSGIYQQICCPPNDKQYLYYKGQASDCRNTTCVSKGSTSLSNDMCIPYMPNVVYVNREEQQYVETVRDECVDENGNLGIAALCCPPDSMDVMLTTLVGAEPEEFPFFARVGNYGCGGSVYNEQWIITAAHCVTDNEKKRIWDLERDGERAWYDHVGTVRINILMRDIPTERIYTVEEVHVFPNSSWTQPSAPKGTSSWGDMALLKLQTKIQFGEKVKAIKIAEPGYDPLKFGTRGILTGFGVTDTLRNPMKMQKANMVIRRKDQVNILRSQHDQLLFAGGIMNGVVSPNVGTGDSGGPFVCRDENGMGVLCGVVSFMVTSSETCLNYLIPAGCQPTSFNDVGYFHDWIVETAGGQENAELWEEPIYGEVVGGEEYPAHVHITNEEGEPCGGTLVEDDLVLTTTSCMLRKDGTYKYGLKVTIGTRDANEWDGRTIGVKNMVIMGPFTEVKRPAWGGGGDRKRMTQLPYEAWREGKWGNEKIQKDPYYKDNVALVKLASKSGRTPAKLGSRKLHTGDMAMEVAFRTEAFGTDSEGSLPLTRREFKLLDEEECQRRMDRLAQVPYDVKIDDNVICGVEKISGGSLCDRELGGGLYCKGDNGQDELCGIQVFRLCDFSIPNEFVEVSKIRNWLDAAIQRLENE